MILNFKINKKLILQKITIEATKLLKIHRNLKVTKNFLKIKTKIFILIRKTNKKII